MSCDVGFFAFSRFRNILCKKKTGFRGKKTRELRMARYTLTFLGFIIVGPSWHVQDNASGTLSPDVEALEANLSASNVRTVTTAP